MGNNKRYNRDRRVLNQFVDNQFGEAIHAISVHKDISLYHLEREFRQSGHWYQGEIHKRIRDNDFTLSEMESLAETLGVRMDILLIDDEATIRVRKSGMKQKTEHMIKELRIYDRPNKESE